MSNWVIRIVEVQKREVGAFYLFELFRKNKGGIDIPLTSTPEPLVLSEEHFHELTADLMADVYNEGLLIPTLANPNWKKAILDLSYIPLHYRHDVIRSLENWLPPLPTAVR